jgi:hypothetical protein
MSLSTPQPDLPQDCLAKLNRALDLVLKSAETASAEGNHKIVIQAAREVTRIVTLITKMTDPKAKSGPKSTFIPLASPAGPVRRQSEAPPAGKRANSPTGKAGPGPQAAQSNRKPGKHPPAGALPNLDSLFQPDDLDDLDPISLEILQDIMK